jgi:hypothetical protein
VEDFDAKEREGGRWDKRSFAFAEIMRKNWGPLLHIFEELQTALVRRFCQFVKRFFNDFFFTETTQY